MSAQRAHAVSSKFRNNQRGPAELARAPDPIETLGVPKASVTFRSVATGSQITRCRFGRP